MSDPVTRRPSYLPTILIAALLAVAASAGVYFFQSVPQGKRHAESDVARHMLRAVVAQLTLTAAQVAGDSTQLPVLRGQAARAAQELAASLRSQRLSAEQVDRALAALAALPDAEAQAAVDDTLATAKLGIRLHARARSPQQVAVYVPLGGPLIRLLGEPLAADHGDDWLLREAPWAISVRGVERDVVSDLLAAHGEPTLCPVDIRLATHLPLGGTFDALAAEAVRRSFKGPFPATAKTALGALCRRERLRRLAHEELQQKGQKFPFVPGLIMTELDRALLARLQDPNQVAGLGGKARNHMLYMSNAEYDWAPQAHALEPAARAIVATRVKELGVFAEARSRSLAAAPSKPVHPAVQALVSDQDKWTATMAELCGLLAATLATDEPRLFAARVYSRVSTDVWPNEPERSGILAYAYALGELPVPKTSVAAGAQLWALWQKTEEGLGSRQRARAIAETHCPPFSEVPTLPQATLNHVVAELLAE